MSGTKPEARGPDSKIQDCRVNSQGCKPVSLLAQEIQGRESWVFWKLVGGENDLGSGHVSEMGV